MDLLLVNFLMSSPWNKFLSSEHPLNELSVDTEHSIDHTDFSIGSLTRLHLQIAYGYACLQIIVYGYH